MLTVAEKKKMEERRYPAIAKKMTESVSLHGSGYEIENRGTKGLRISLAQKGLLRGSFAVPENLSDKDGNWHIGAIGILMDNIGCAAVGSWVGGMKASVNFDISYLSPVKIQEQVEVEAKVLNNREKLSSVVVEIRRKENGELVAFGKQWMTSFDPKARRPSKL